MSCIFALFQLIIRADLKNIIPSRLLDRVHYLDYAGEDLEEWTKKVYQVVLKQSDKDS